MTHYSTAHALTQPGAFTQSVGVKRHATAARHATARAAVRPVQVTGDPGRSEEIEERRRRVGRAVLGGERVAAEDIRANEGWFVQAHHGVYRALATARGLTSDQLRYLLCLLEYSLGLGFTYAARDFSGAPARMADWQAWLGGMNPKQIFRAKRALFDAGVIFFLDGDTDRVALNLHWETWRVRWDAATPGRNPRGRRASSGAEQLALWPEQAAALGGSTGGNRGGARRRVASAEVVRPDSAFQPNGAWRTTPADAGLAGVHEPLQDARLSPERQRLPQAPGVANTPARSIRPARAPVEASTIASEGVCAAPLSADRAARPAGDAPRRRALSWPDQVIERMRYQGTYRFSMEVIYDRARAYEDLDCPGRITLECDDERAYRRLQDDLPHINAAWQALYRSQCAGVVDLRLGAGSRHPRAATTQRPYVEGVT